MQLVGIPNELLALLLNQLLITSSAMIGIKTDKTVMLETNSVIAAAEVEHSRTSMGCGKSFILPNDDAMSFDNPELYIIIFYLVHVVYVSVLYNSILESTAFKIIKIHVVLKNRQYLNRVVIS